MAAEPARPASGAGSGPGAGAGPGVGSTPGAGSASGAGPVLGGGSALGEGSVPEAVVFDLDGVLVDSFDVMRRAFEIAYAEVVGDGPAPFEEYSKHLGRYFPDIMRIMGLPPEIEEPFVRESYRLAGEVTVFDGVRPLLEELRRRGVALAVATGKSGPRARSLLEGLGIAGHFAHIIGSDEVPRPKPAPDIVRRALDLLGVPPGRAVMVGDAVTDLRAARGAGVGAVAALWGESEAGPLLAERPDAVLHRPADLLDLLPVLTGAPTVSEGA